MQNSLLSLIVGVTLVASAHAGAGQEASTNQPQVVMREAFLKHLFDNGNQFKLIDAQHEADQVRRWKEFLAPTFPMKLRYDSASRIVFEATGKKQVFVLFAFATPSDLRGMLPEFNQFKLSGVLRSEALTYYYAAGTPEVFAILLSEQKPIPSDSDAISALATALAQAPWGPPAKLMPTPAKP